MPGLPTRPVFYDVDLDLETGQGGRVVLTQFILVKPPHLEYNRPACEKA